ncbi:adenylate/guanylate cyclase domain-containing protein, partial [bacterium]|nr:adenylate/guanylate cyclase domain-containing protein [bacterium]
ELTTPGLTIILAHTLVGIVYTIRERKEKKQVRSLFSHYVPKRIIAELAKNPASIKLGGERREVTILFADIEDFTAISEKIPPEEMVRLLNQYMTEMTRIIQQQGGIIDKYEGDAIMAEFGVPGHLENHAEHACRAALRMQNRLAELGQIWQESGYPELKTRIGINTGQVIVGNMGSATLFDYTVLGSEVNLCARLEKANKLYKTQILISESTFAAISDTFVTRVIGDIDLRGRTEAVRIHELIAEDMASLKEEDIEFVTLYRAAWSCLEKQQVAQALKLFERINELDPTDLATRINLERSRRLASSTTLDELPSAPDK